MSIVLYWNIFIDVNRPEAERQIALKSIYLLENKKLRRIAESKKEINRDRAIEEDDMLHSAFEKILNAGRRGGLPALNSSEGVIGYFAQTIINICRDGYRRGERFEPLDDHIPFAEIDDIVGFEFIQGFKKFGQSQTNRPCYELIKRKASGYSYLDLIDTFEDYSELEEGALTMRYKRCKEQLNQFLNR